MTDTQVRPQAEPQPRPPVVENTPELRRELLAEATSGMWPWRPGQFGHLLASPPMAAACIYAATTLAHGLGVDAWIATAACALIGLAAVAGLAAEHTHWGGLAYMSVLTAGAATWVGVHAGDGPFDIRDLPGTGETFLHLVIATLAMLVAYVFVVRWQPKVKDLPILHPTPAEFDRIVDELLIDEHEKVAAAAGLKGIKHVSTTLTAHGRVVRMRTTSGGALVDDVIARLGKLEHELPAKYPGATRIEPVEGDIRAFDWHISEQDQLAKVRPMPDDHSPLDINNAFLHGHYDDGAEVLVKIPGNPFGVFGVRGSGKTGSLSGLIWQVTRCTNAICLACDPKGGVLVKPWLEPFALGHTTVPLIDWVACEIDEYENLAAMLLAVGQYRFSLLGSTDKITAAPELPHLIPILDEIDDIIGLNGSRQAFKSWSRVGSKLRAAAVDLVAASQRTTADQTGGRAFISQLPGRMIHGAADTKEVYQLLDLAKGRVRIEDFRHPGSYALARTGVDTERDGVPARACFVDYARIPAAARAHTPHRTAWDDGSLAIARKFGYDKRWTTGSGARIIAEIRRAHNYQTPATRTQLLLAAAITAMGYRTRMPTAEIVNRLRTDATWGQLTVDEFKRMASAAGVKTVQSGSAWPGNPRGYDRNHLTDAAERLERTTT